MGQGLPVLSRCEGKVRQLALLGPGPLRKGRPGRSQPPAVAGNRWVALANYATLRPKLNHYTSGWYQNLRSRLLWAEDGLPKPQKVHIQLELSTFGGWMRSLIFGFDNIRCAGNEQRGHCDNTNQYGPSRHDYLLYNLCLE